jgi:pectate lyase
MKRLVLLILFLSAGLSYAQQLAFPGAEGYGKYASGGREGVVYEVTTLNSSGTGSLGEAISASGARTVVLKVSGTIDGDFTISNGNITIAGQTAPGDGIAIKGKLSFDNVSNVIVRYIRVRGEVNGDAIGGRYNDNIIIDHVSTSWSSDEVMSIYHGNNITIQWCMITEACGGGHAFGGIWGNNHSTYHHNLFAHNVQRNPRIASGAGFNDLRNNVIYNWESHSIYGGEKHQGSDARFQSCSTNVVANYLKPGPGTLAKDAIKICSPWSRERNGGDADWGKWYVADNYMFDNDSVTEDNWKGVVPVRWMESEPHEVWLLDKRELLKLDTPSEFMSISQQSAEEAYLSVLEQAGCSYPKRDAIDERIIEEVSNGTATYGNGFASSPGAVGGYPVLASGTAYIDSDHDGMSNEWEKAHGLDTNNAADRNGIGEGGYTNLEVFLYSLLGDGGPVTGVSVSPTTESINIGTSMQLSATVYPYNALNKNVSWESDNSSVATVNTSGLVTSVAKGSATITVTTEDGSFTATSNITVLDPSSTGITKTNKDILIYPVPFSNRLNIQVGREIAEPVDILLLDSTGKIIQYKKAVDLNHQLNVTDLNEGLYFVRVVGTTINFIETVVKINK